MTDIIERLETEAGLCRNETATDIAMLLDEAALEIGNERRRTQNARKELSDLDAYRIGQIEKLNAELAEANEAIAATREVLAEFNSESVVVMAKRAIEDRDALKAELAEAKARNDAQAKAALAYLNANIELADQNLALRAALKRALEITDRLAEQANICVYDKELSTLRGTVTEGRDDATPDNR